MESKNIGIGNATPRLAALQDIINKKTQDEVDLMWELISLFMFERFKTEDMVKIYKEVGRENFVKLVQAVGGKEVKFPSKDELLDNLIASLLYIDRELRKMSWSSIKKKYPTIDVKSIKYAIKIKNLDAFTESKIDLLMKSKNIDTQAVDNG